MARVGLAGLGYWGPNLARNFDELADLTWLCDLDGELRDRFAKRYPAARVTASFEEMLGDESLDAVIVATPVPTRSRRSRPASTCSSRSRRRCAPPRWTSWSRSPQVLTAC